MFQINTYLLYKMGWRVFVFKIPRLPDPVVQYLDKEVKLVDGDFYFLEEKKLSLIKQKKQETYNTYQLLVIDFNQDEISTTEFEIDSNIKLIQLIRENLLCDMEYQRYFRINSILK
jgi:hypothetical protein